MFLLKWPKSGDMAITNICYTCNIHHQCLPKEDCRWGAMLAQASARAEPRAALSFFNRNGAKRAEFLFN